MNALRLAWLTGASIEIEVAARHAPPDVRGDDNETVAPADGRTTHDEEAK
ncbi:MAG: hypothetical protein ACREX3_09110 [Gammaproteobacteria bacterium]